MKTLREIWAGALAEVFGGREVSPEVLDAIGVLDDTIRRNQAKLEAMWLDSPFFATKSKDVEP